MTDFVSWLKTDDAGFRDFYFQVTGETVQEYAKDADAKRQAGTSRLTPEMKTQLVTRSGVDISDAPTSYISLAEQQHIAAELANA